MNEIKINDRNYKVVSSYEEAIKELEKNGTAAMYEFGDSLYPIIKSGEYSAIEVINTTNDVQVGDCVFCYVPNIGYMIHMVLMKSHSSANGNYFLIGSSRYDFYGWTSEIIGKVKGTNIFYEENR